MADTVMQLVEERNKQKQYVEEEKPYWMNLRHPRGKEMRYDLNNYFPDAHYKMAIDQLLKDIADPGLEDTDEDLVPDGGRNQTQYFWSGEDGVLYHTETGDDRVNPFFNTIEEAERFLEHQAEKHSKERYKGMVLRKSGNQKVEEAVEVLMDQSGIDEFL